jgi:hypothetical protein
MSLLIIDFLIRMINYKAIKITLTFAVEFLCLFDWLLSSNFSHVGASAAVVVVGWFARLPDLQS